jgi:hypothetical protein
LNAERIWRIALEALVRGFETEGVSAAREASPGRRGR